MDNENRAVDIVSANGMGGLYFQFRYPDAEKRSDPETYEAYYRLLHHCLRNQYMEESERIKQRFGYETVYEVTYSEYENGFCLCVRLAGGIGEEQALGVLKRMLEYVISFDPRSLNYPNDELKRMMTDKCGGAKAQAEQTKERVFGRKLYTFKEEYWNPWD